MVIRVVLDSQFHASVAGLLSCVVGQDLMSYAAVLDLLVASLGSQVDAECQTTGSSVLLLSASKVAKGSPVHFDPL